MLNKSVKMNLKICERHAFKCFGWPVFAFILMDIFTIPAIAAAFIYVILAYRNLFDRSLFGEEAYTYMLVPISIKDMVLGKAIAANLCMMISFAIVCATLLVAGLLTGEVSTDLGIGSIGGHLLQSAAGMYEATEDGVVAAGEIIYSRDMLIKIAVALILLPVVFLSVSIFFCAVFQLGAVIRHLLDPQRSSSLATVCAVFGGLAVIFAVMALTKSLDYLWSGDAVTIWTSVVWIVIPSACGIGMLAGSIKILEKKYSLV